MQEEQSRYSCQVKLPGFGEEKQELLKGASILIVGIGGLGCPAAQYLASSGVGKLTFADGDVVSTTNLHRQILFNESEIGEKKVVVAQRKLSAQNPHIQIEAFDVHASTDNVMALVGHHDLILDCTDNFNTKYLLNDACVLAGKPLIYGAIYQCEGQISIFNALNSDSSRSTNYRDVFPNVDSSQIPDCNDGGVIPTLAGLVGLMQANEAIKYITGIGEPLISRLAIIDALTLQTRIIKLPKQTKTNITCLSVANKGAIITLTELNALLGQDDIFLLDVRNPEEHVAFNIGGINIPLSQLNDNIWQLKQYQTIVAYCATGKRSAEAVKLLNSKLQDIKVLSLEKGIESFQ